MKLAAGKIVDDIFTTMVYLSECWGNGYRLIDILSTKAWSYEHHQGGYILWLLALLSSAAPTLKIPAW